MGSEQALSPEDLEQDATGGPVWLARVREALSRAPDPGNARALALPALQAAPHAELDALSPKHAEQLADVVLALCGIAPFFAPRLQARPEWLLGLARDDLAAERESDDLEAALDAELALAGDAADGLRRFKYRELARITVRDCSARTLPLAQSGATLRDLSRLADTLLGRALALAQGEHRRRLGPPRWHAEDGRNIELSFVALGLGKLGGEELNYSSDVDLVYVFEAPPAGVELEHGREGCASLPPVEYFTRLAQQFGNLVEAVRPEGFLYRIDLDLRPEGGQGMVVVSDEAFAVYYETWAETWERATFTKARPVAGDLGFGWRTIRQVDPTIYRSAMDITAIESIRQLTRRIAATHAEPAGAFNVKLGPGGIRDLELIAQALQLMHGGRIEEIRSRSTLDALERLRDVRLLSREQSKALIDAYLFLRRLENRLQMVAERQTHRLAADAVAREKIARAMGYAGADAGRRFEHDLQARRDAVRQGVALLFPEREGEPLFALFAQQAPSLLGIDGSRQQLGALAERFALEIGRSADPDRARNNLDHFVRGLGARRFYLELLIDRPELVPRLTALLASSSYLSSILAAQPELIEPVFLDPNVLLLEREELETDFDAIHAECAASREDVTDAQLAALRRFRYRQTINAGLLDLGGHVGRGALQAALTDIAEVCVARALAWSRQWLEERSARAAETGTAAGFVVIGMGKLASRELSYGSDLDLIFVFEPESDDEDGRGLIEAQEQCTRLSQRLISMLQIVTEDGACYEIDPRLRPSGNQGTLVSSIAALEHYHLSAENGTTAGEEERGSVIGAALWERMALLRARPSCGDRELGARFERLRARVLRRPLPADALDEIAHVRGRMERELARESERRHDFKRGHGGLLDVETAVQYLQLRHGRNHPRLLEVTPVEAQLDALADLGLLAPEHATALRDGWEFLQRLSSRVRVVENRAVSDLDEERGDLDALARTLGYPSTGRPGGARRALLADYHRHTNAVRAAYGAVMRVH